jgi:DNA-binding beta-propeller fold protein YncE
MFKKIITILFAVAAFAATACIEEEFSHGDDSDVAFVGQDTKGGPEFVLITNPNFYTVTKIRMSDLSISSVSAGPRPSKIFVASDNRNVFIFSDLEVDNAFAWIDVRTDVMHGYYDLGYPHNAASFADNNKVAFSPDSKFAIIQSYPGATIFMFDLINGVLHRYLQPNLIFQDVYIAENGQVFFINAGGGVNAVRFDSDTQAFETLNGTFLEIGWHNDKYFAFDEEGDQVVIIDTVAGDVSYLDIPADAQSFAADDELNVIALGSVGSGDQASSLTLYRPESGNSTKIDLQVKPTGLMASPDGSWAIAFDRLSNVVEAIDLERGEVLDQVQVSTATPDDEQLIDDQSFDMTSERALLVDLKRERLVTITREGDELNKDTAPLDDLPTKIAFDPTGKVALFSATEESTSVSSRLYRVNLEEDFDTTAISLSDDFDFFSFTTDGSKAVTRINGLDPEYDASISMPCKPQWTFQGIFTWVTGETDTLAVDGSITSECEPELTQPQDKIQIVDLQNFDVDYVNFPREILYQHFRLDHDIVMFVDKVKDTSDSILGLIGVERNILRGGIVSLLYPEMGLMTGQGEDPKGFFIDPAGRMLYITMNYTHEVSVFDLNDYRTFSFSSGIGPMAVAFSPDSRYGFISHGTPLGLLSFYDSISERVFKRILAPGAHGIFDEY